MASQEEVQKARAKLLRVRAEEGARQAVREGVGGGRGPAVVGEGEARSLARSRPLPGSYVHPSEVDSAMYKVRQQDAAGPGAPAALPQTLRVDVGAEAQADLDERVRRLQPPPRSPAQAVAAASPQPGASTPPRAEVLKQALGEPAYENPVYPVGGDASTTPGTTIDDDGNVTTDDVNVGKDLTIEDMLFHKVDPFGDIEPEDFSGMERVERGRKRDAQRDAQAGMLLSTFGGRRLSPQGGQLLQKALASKPVRPNAADLGYFDPETGDYIENPTTNKIRDQNVAASRLDALNRQSNVEAQRQANRLKQLENAQSKDEDRALRREIAEANIRQKELELAQKYAAEEAKYGQGVKGLQTKKGLPVYAGKGDGAGKFVDGEGNVVQPMTHGDANKARKAINGAMYQIKELDSLAEEVVKYHEGFGRDVALASTSNAVLNRYLSQEEIATRVRVYNRAYKTINDLAGAALSMGEIGRIEPFVPNADDTARQVATKLWEAKREFNRILAEYGEPEMDMGPMPGQNLSGRDKDEPRADISKIPKRGGGVLTRPPVGYVIETPGEGVLRRVR